MSHTAVVTGASRGIGAACAAALAGAGYHVVSVARSEGEYRCDLTDLDAWGRVSARILAERGVPEVVVNNAGGYFVKPLAETAMAEFRELVALNLTAGYAVARAFLPAMSAAGRGSFISIGSIADHVGFAENSAYAATKYGLRGLHEALLDEYRGSGVRLTLVSPGPVNTTLWDPIDPDAREGYTPRAEMLTPADVAEAVLFAATRPPHVHLDLLRLGPTG
ncbi:MAG TPA: SDR family NAD(P)-dependent oxidoreductase [Gemmatimonadales bacterium]|nr:SDR family NAD(P)-dependent oxidoreductase [Gemmatimonadales bacterium]